jgi:hypothetical protein
LEKLSCRTSEIFARKLQVKLPAQFEGPRELRLPVKPPTARAGQFPTQENVVRHTH